MVRESYYGSGECQGGWRRRLAMGFAAGRNDPELGSGRWYGPASCLVSADANCDCQADLGDVVLVASAWRCRSGDGCYDPYRDVNNDGAIGIADVAFVAVRLGEVCW